MSEFFSKLSWFDFSGDSSWVYWGAALLIGFPIAVVYLSELAFDLGRKGQTAYLTPLDLFRNSTLFLIFVSILLRVVIGLPGDHIAVRLADTALWITVINLALAVFNLLFFTGAEGTWRAQTPKLLVDLCRLFIVAVCAAFVVSQIWGLDLKAMLAALGVGSLVIGLALQDTLGNLFSGIAVVSARQFKIGDWIRVGDIEGQVRSVNWRSVSVATTTGDLVVIPNGQIARERLRNYGADKGWSGVLIEFKIPNDQPPQPVLDLILATAATTANVLEDPKPLARIVSFDDADIQYRAILYIRDYKSINAVRTDFLANLWYNASRERIPLPPRPVIARTAAADVAWSRPAAALPAAIAAKLAALDTFKRSRDRLDAVAEDSRLEVYRRGQMLIKAGQSSSRFYVVTAGRIAACVTTGATKDIVEEFGPGEIVLYKTFLRNGASPFDVEAKGDAEVISIPVHRLEGLLAADPELGTDIERLLGLREEAAHRATLKLGAEHLNGKADTSRVDILKEMFRV
jgi:small-conductance mechanosensitive channel